MRSRSDLHHYQDHAATFATNEKRCLLALDLGLGKTSITLTGIVDILADPKITLNRILIIAPLRVANSVWHEEAAKWAHTKHLTFSICTGSAAARLAALRAKADIYVINRENVPWLVTLCRGNWPFDFVVIDESTSFKSRTSKRFKALKSILHRTKYMWLLSGTPSPNGLMDLWTQLYLIDGGQRLGKTITNYRTRFFDQDYYGFGYTVKEDSPKKIYSLISDKVLSMSSEDYLELPERIDLIEKVALSPKERQQYKDFKKHAFAEYGGKEITAVNAAVLLGKLLQYSNGSMYLDGGGWHGVHNAKFDALADFLDQNDNENALIAYNFKFDLERLQKRFPHAVLLDKDPEKITRWNRGEIKLLLAHPESCGPGLNLQHGGNLLIWFGLTWNLEHYQQLNKRLHRQGQNKPVRIVHLITMSTIESRVIKVLENKGLTQDALLSAVKYME